MLDRVLAVLVPLILAAGVTMAVAPAAAQLTPTAPSDPALRFDPNAAGPGLQGTTAPTAPAVPSGAQVRETPGAFVVSNVAVDATAGSTAAAQEQAFADGRRLAFAALLAQLGVRRDQVDPAAMQDGALSRLTRGFSVEEESISPGRYRARLSYIFNPDAVRDLLSERAVTTLEEARLPSTADGAVPGQATGAPVLVLPVLRDGAAARLWDSPNPWLDAWQNLDTPDRVAVPYGELQDVADVSVEAALRGDGAAFRGIAGRYGAGDTVVAVAQETGGGLSVSLTRYSGAGPGATQILSVPGTDYAAAVREAVSALDRPAPERPGLAEETPGAGPAMAAGPAVGGLPPGDRLGGGMPVLVPFSRPAEWFQIRQRLAAVGNVVGVQVVSLSVDEAVLRLQFAGGEEALRGGLATQGLQLTRGPAGAELRLSGTAF